MADPETVEHAEGGVATNRRSAAATATRIPLEGELDVSSAPSVRARLGDVCDRNPGSEFIFDLAGVTFVDSTGLGVLVGAARRVRAAGGEVQLTGCRRSIRRVLVLTGLDRILRLDHRLATGEGDGSEIPVHA